MKFKELMNKEVIDQKGNSISKVKTLNGIIKVKKSLIEVGSGEIREVNRHIWILSYDKVENIGDKVLLKKSIWNVIANDENDALDYYNL